MIRNQEFPSDEEWNETGQLADQAVRKLLTALCTDHIASGNSRTLLYALAHGAITAAGDFVRTITKQPMPHEIEAYAIAYLRGALRGLDRPTDEDGSEFEYKAPS